ncbi:CRAL-TRIO domain-containing protein, partial [Tanacetum coccineum]
GLQVEDVWIDCVKCVDIRDARTLNLLGHLESLLGSGSISQESMEMEATSVDGQCIRSYYHWNVEMVIAKQEEVAADGETGKIFKGNFYDGHGRTILIMKPGLQITASLDSQIKQLVYTMENAILNLPQGQEEIVWLLDFIGLSFRINVPIKTARDSVNILQNHYPHRLGAAILYSPPRIIEAFWKVCVVAKWVDQVGQWIKLLFYSYLDPKHSEKVQYIYQKNKVSMELMKSYFDALAPPPQKDMQSSLSMTSPLLKCYVCILIHELTNDKLKRSSVGGLIDADILQEEPIRVLLGRMLWEIKLFRAAAVTVQQEPIVVETTVPLLQSS